MKNKTYTGRRTLDGCKVLVDDRPLNLRLDLWNHSPAGFEWGYGGSGPTQLALAILTDYLGDEVEAMDLHQPFKRLVIARLRRDAWSLTSDEVAAALATLDRQIGDQE